MRIVIEASSMVYYRQLATIEVATNCLCSVSLFLFSACTTCCLIFAFAFFFFCFCVSVGCRFWAEHGWIEPANIV